jgi:hypothetical protein
MARLVAILWRPASVTLPAAKPGGDPRRNFYTEEQRSPTGQDARTPKSAGFSAAPFLLRWRVRAVHGKESAMTLVCCLCKTLQGDVYRVPIAGVGDVIMCNHVVESVVEIHRLVCDDPDVEPAAPRPVAGWTGRR